MWNAPRYRGRKSVFGAGLRRVLSRTVGRFAWTRNSHLLKQLAAQVQVGRGEGLRQSGEEDEPAPWARLAIRDSAARAFRPEHCSLLIGVGEKPAWVLGMQGTTLSSRKAYVPAIFAHHQPIAFVELDRPSKPDLGPDGLGLGRLDAPRARRDLHASRGLRGIGILRRHTDVAGDRPFDSEPGGDHHHAYCTPGERGQEHEPGCK